MTDKIAGKTFDVVVWKVDCAKVDVRRWIAQHYNYRSKAEVCRIIWFEGGLCKTILLEGGLCKTVLFEAKLF